MKKSALILILLLAFLPCRAQGIFRLTKLKQVQMENAVLLSRLDSLQALVDSLQERKYLESETLQAIMEGNEEEPFTYSLEVTDSLVNLWYENSRITDFDAVHDYDMDSVRFSSDVPDSVLVQRLADMNSFITLPFNETVKNYMILYAERRSGSLSRVLGLSKYYFPIFESAFLKYDLPQELKYMAIIESMLNPVATSRAGARGMWQFMYNTAKIYGLHVDSFIDERLDVEMAVDAAARYLKDSYEMFGDWALAISSYNCGAGNVTKAIRRAGGSRDFWDIYPFLPRETRGYVPAFVGAMYAMTYYREYGIVPDDVGLPAQTDTFQITRKLHFSQINEVVGVPLEDLKNLNPKYTHDIIPGTAKDMCVLNLPYNWVTAFMEADQDSLYNHRLAELISEDVQKAADTRKTQERITYRVKSGDYLGRIASRYNVSVSKLKEWNNLRSSNIRVGQVLYIYTNGYSPSKTAATSASSTSSSGTASAKASSTAVAKPVDASSGKTVITVKSGESLYIIAKRYPGVSAQNIMDANGLTSANIKPGQKLIIPKP